MIKTINKNSILSGAIGNFIEVYDYSHYMYFAPIIAAIFFPFLTSGSALIYTFFIFAIERLIRPIGSIYIGYLVDKHGRSKTLYYSIIGMVIVSFLMCILPTYHSIGIMAPILLLLIRTTQGVFLSGEFITSIVYITEHAPESKKGILGSLAFCSGIAGSILSSIISFLIIYLLPKQQVANWGWKIPYLAGIFIICFGYKLRKNLHETPDFKQLIIFEENPIKIALKKHYREIIVCFLLTCLSATTFSIFLIYMPSHLNYIKQLSLPFSLALTTINLIFYALFLPIMGNIADKIGKIKLILFSSLGIIIFTYPVFYIINTAMPVFIEGTLLGYMILLAGLNGPLPAFLTKLFPTSVRTTSLALGYGTSLSIFGGFAPLICIYLTRIASINAPAIYVMFSALFAIVCLCFKKRESNKN